MEENTTAPDVVRDDTKVVGPKNTATWKTPTGKPPEPPRAPEPPAEKK